MRVHGTSCGSGRRRERRFGGSSSLFRPTTGTPTGCELFACDDAALIHGVKVEPLLEHYLEGIISSMLKVVATRATRMPASPAAWSSSSRTRVLFGGGVGGGGEAGGGEVVFVDGDGGGITVWQLTPSYPELHDVHVHDPDPAVPPTVPPLMQ